MHIAIANLYPKTTQWATRVLNTPRHKQIYLSKLFIAKFEERINDTIAAVAVSYSRDQSHENLEKINEQLSKLQFDLQNFHREAYLDNKVGSLLTQTAMCRVLDIETFIENRIKSENTLANPRNKSKFEIELAKEFLSKPNNGADEFEQLLFKLGYVIDFAKEYSKSTYPQMG